MTDHDPPEGNEDPTWIDSAAIRGPSPPDKSTGGGAPEPTEDGAANERLGDFELLQEIGRGGMGIVWEARQVSLNRRVALKVLPPALGMSSEATKRFSREAQAAAKLHHTNIVPVYAIGEQDGNHFYVMELIEGQALDGVLEDLSRGSANALFEASVSPEATRSQIEAAKRPAPDETSSSVSDSPASRRDWFDGVVRLIAEIADALHYAHAKGVIHRDIKPGNLILSTEGRLCVTDFGLARMLQEPGLTVSGSFLGTPAYMSPEQIAVGRVAIDHRSDVYSLGAVLYELLTLKRPFTGQTREQVLSGVLTKDPKRPRRINPKIPLDLETICLKAMEKDPDRRYASAEVFAQDLRQYLQRGLITARRAGPIRRTWKFLMRHQVASIAVTSVIALALVVGGSWRLIQSERGRGSLRQAVSEARIDLTAGLYQDGLEWIDQALEIEPGSQEARLLRANLLIKLDRGGDAIEEAQSILQHNPDDWTAHLILASAAGGTVGRARYPQIDIQQHIRFVEEHAPESAEAYYLRSILAEPASKRMTLLDRAIELDPGHADSLVERINLNKDVLMNFPAAMQDCGSLIIARSRSALGRRMRARVYYAQTKYDDALAEIERAIELDPADSHNYPVRAMIYRKTGLLDEAIADLSHAIELAPDSVLHWYDRAGTYNLAGRFEEALEDSRKAFTLTRDFEPIYGEMFRSLHSLDRKDDLRANLALLRDAAESWQDDRVAAAAHRTTAYYYRVLKDYGAALGVAEQATEMAPENYRGYIRLALIGRDTDDDALFDSACDTIVSLRPQDPKEWIDRGWDVGFDCGRWDDALVDLEAAVTAFPTWFTAYHRRGTAYLALGRLDEALADLSRSIELAPRYPSSYGHRANVLEQMYRPHEALADREKALELDPYTSSLSYSNLGNSYFGIGRIEDSVASHDRAIGIDPLYTHSYALRAIGLPYLGRCDEALEDIVRSKELATTGHADDYATVYVNLAEAHLSSLYYHCPAQFDAAAALDLAEAAHGYRRERTQNILADALYRNGRFAEARNAFEAAFEETKGTGVWFNYAMCLWQLGEKGRARELFDRSTRWMDEHKPNPPAHVPKRREAANLLGISDSG